MKKGRTHTRKALLTTAVVTLSAIVVAHEAGAADVNLNINAVIVPSPLAANAIQDLDFGAFFPGGAPSTIDIDTAGVPTYGVGIAPEAPPVSEGIIHLVGSTGSVVNLSLTNNTATITNGTTNMVVSQFQINTDAGGTTEAVTLPGSTLDVPIGGTLNVGAGQAFGTYNGTITVNASY